MPERAPRIERSSRAGSGQRLAFGTDAVPEAGRTQPDPAVAARLLFLNKTCFNGLYRVNGRGRFNVPLDRWRAHPTVADPTALRAASGALQGTTLAAGDFGSALERADDAESEASTARTIAVVAIAIAAVALAFAAAVIWRGRRSR